MPRKKVKRASKPFPVADVPTNPEFKAFMDATRRVMQTPKEEVDQRLKDEAERRNPAS